MPTYEYECKKCGITFEKFQSITADPLRECPTCGGAVRRLIGSGAGIIFKGNGFYSTDYRSDSYKKKAREEQSSHSNASTASSPCTSCPQGASCANKK